jgi:hypothetical protein
MRNEIQRRDVLKAGIMATAAALLPREAAAAGATAHEATPGMLVERLSEQRAAYLAWVERFAIEEAKPRFLTGEWGGFKTGDGDRETAARRAGEEWLSPRARFEDTIRETAMASLAEACVVLAVSPSAPLLYGSWDGAAGTRAAAAECITLDCFRVGLRQGWYTPEPEEEPSADELLGLNLRVVGDEEEVES